MDERNTNSVSLACDYLRTVADCSGSVIFEEDRGELVDIVFLSEVGSSSVGVHNTDVVKLLILLYPGGHSHPVCIGGGGMGVYLSLVHQ